MLVLLCFYIQLLEVNITFNLISFLLDEHTELDEILNMYLKDF